MTKAITRYVIRTLLYPATCFVCGGTMPQVKQTAPGHALYFRRKANYSVRVCSRACRMEGK